MAVTTEAVANANGRHKGATASSSASSSSTNKQTLNKFDLGLIGVVFIALGVMVHHTYEGYINSQDGGGGGGGGGGKGAKGGFSSSSSPSAQPGQSFTHNFTGDPLSGKGWWGAQTSAMNFCEEDHVVTFAIAEFINTLSNLAYVYFAFATFPSKEGGGATWWAPPATNLSLLLLGLSSGVYHATLKHYNQIWDESGMYLLVASMDWYIYSYPGAVFSGPIAKPVYTLVLWGSCAAVVVLNFLDTRGADFGLHTILFIALLSALWPRCLWLIAERRRLERDGLLRPGAISVATISNRCRVGGACFLLGFGFWLVDCVFCYELRALRRQVGLPLAWLLECHGWWHVLTAVGAGVFVDLTNLFSSPIQGNVVFNSAARHGNNNDSNNKAPIEHVNGDVKLETKKD